MTALLDKGKHNRFTLIKKKRSFKSANIQSRNQRSHCAKLNLR